MEDYEWESSEAGLGNSGGKYYYRPDVEKTLKALDSSHGYLSKKVEDL